MREILPGRPESKLQAISVGLWNSQQIIAFVSGNALIILESPNSLLQTIYLAEDVQLEAVEVDVESGQIATCAGSTVYVYKPYGQDEGALKWSLQFTLSPKKDRHDIKTLSWGLPGELLLSNSSLNLYDISDSTKALWTRKLAIDVQCAKFSYDSSLIATNGKHDRLVKTWTRLSFGTDNVQFDFTYLAHPASVTGLHWRRPFQREQLIDNILYTFCADKKLRIWASLDPHGLQTLQLWGEIDLLDSKIHGSLPQVEDSDSRHAFVIDSCDFTHSTERAVQLAKNDEKEQKTLARLIELAHRNPEVIVILDNRGHMSAWGLENVGSKNRKPSDLFNIVQNVETQISLNVDTASSPNYLNVNTICGENTSLGIMMLVHHYGGSVQITDARLDYLFDPSYRSDRLLYVCTWTGHSRSIEKVSRTATGNAILSRSIRNECIVWRKGNDSSKALLTRHSAVSVLGPIHKTCILNEGNFVVFLHPEKLSLWDTSLSTGHQIEQCSFEILGKPLCLILIPEEKKVLNIVHIATISSCLKGIVWEIRLPQKFESDGLSQSNGHVFGYIKEFSTFNLCPGNDLSFIIPVDPAGSSGVAPGFLDTFAKDIITGFTSSGVLRSWTAKIDHERREVSWLLTTSVDTGITNPSIASGSSIRKAAMVDSNRAHLTIWDTRSATLEYDEKFETHGMIQDLDWTSTPDNQSTLAVGFPHQVVVYAQLRFDYLDAGPSWQSIRQISIRDVTPHPIADSVWLSGGNLVICAGNQLFIEDDYIEETESTADLRLAPRDSGSRNIFSLVSWLNGPLPVFHPQFLSQAVLAGKLHTVQKILLVLHSRLKPLSKRKIDSLLGFSVTDFYEENNVLYESDNKMRNYDRDDIYKGEEKTVFSEEIAFALNEQLTKTHIYQLSSFEQFRLADVVECIGTVEKHRRSLDANGCRFLVFFRQHHVRNRRQPVAELSPISWREIVWAYHSESQDILADLVSRHYHGKMLWSQARESGLFMWMGNMASLRNQFETIARNEYTKTEEKNPIDCTLYYIAMKKKSVLLGLWRMATWHREQRLTLRLLSNNFEESRWKTAAIKNAYALMGKRRFEYAAAFFLLAGHLEDCINILAHQLGDFQLAIAVARVYEGDGGSVLREFIEKKVLPQAALDGNRWLATWAFWMLFKRDKAVRALVSPLGDLIRPPQSPSLKSKIFLTDDPALIVLYKQLREKSLQTLRGALMVSPKVETEFVLQTARLYDRMGCDILALDLVRSWEFLQAPPLPLPSSMPSENGTAYHSQIRSPSSSFDPTDFNPRKLLRRRSSCVVADLPEMMSPPLRSGDIRFEAGANEDLKSPTRPSKKDVSNEKKATNFTEPDPNSLLDSFGF